jgi:fructokinase
METRNDHRVICFGEVLWDILPGAALPGGAPMNVTYHLHKQQKNPALITRIGNDEKGLQLKDIFSEFGVCTDYFQMDSEHQTGKVFAFPNELNEVVYEIVKPVAYDFIEWDDRYEGLVSEADYFVFGSLAARSQTSSDTLHRLFESAKTKVLDINLRAPHYEKEVLESLMGRTDFLKLNLAELNLITSWYSEFTAVVDMVQVLSERFGIPDIVVTMGGDGAYLFMNGHEYFHPGFAVQVKDTVGSGDAFLAGLLSKLMEKEKPEDALEFANAMGALIATKTGACPEYEATEVVGLIKEKAGMKM